MEFRTKLTQTREGIKVIITDFLSKIILEKIFRNYLLLNVSAIIASFVLVWLFASQVGESQIIMHYSINFGVDYIASAQNLYYLPIVGTLFFLVNLFCAYAFNRNDKFFIHLYMLGSWFANNLIIATIGSLYLINFR